MADEQTVIHRLIYEDAEDRNAVVFICACGWRVEATAYGAELAFDKHCKEAGAELQAAQLTDEELSALRKRVAYMVASAAENHEVWIDGEIWQKTLAMIDAISAERDGLKSNAERRRVIFDEALEHLKSEPVHLVLFESNVRLREQLAEVEAERDELRSIGGMPFDEWVDAANIQPRDRRAALLGWNAACVSNGHDWRDVNRRIGAYQDTINEARELLTQIEASNNLAMAEPRKRDTDAQLRIERGLLAQLRTVLGC